MQPTQLGICFFKQQQGMKLTPSKQQILCHDQPRSGHVVMALALTLAALSTGADAQTAPSGDAAGSAASGGPIRLRQPSSADGRAGQDAAGSGDRNGRDLDNAGLAPQADKPTDFEAYVQRLPGGSGVVRFGTDLLQGMRATSTGTDYNPLVPADYLLRAGDELVVTFWGSIDADLRLQVDRSGRITIPRVGPVMVSGVRYADLPDLISKRASQVFKNFQLSVTLGQLRGIRVYVTGFVRKPGTVMVNSLSTLAQALMRAGGPSGAGSYRNIALRRGQDAAVQFDLYNLLLKGDRTGDQRLEADDVIHVGPVGTQVAMIGSFNRPAIFELKPGETTEDALQMAGGFTAVADTQRLVIDRLEPGNANRLSEVSLLTGPKTSLRSGDVVRAFNAAELTRSTTLQSKRIRIEGEVSKPGDYVLAPNTTLAQALREAGGPTPNAYLYATEFNRESVRLTQQQNYERALRDFETQVTSSAATHRANTAEEATASAASNAANSRLIEQLRSLKPTGRVILQTNRDTSELPDLVLEDGDRLYIPPKPFTVGVFGSVFSTGSYLYTPERKLGEYLHMAGGPTKGADESNVFLVRANGTVNSSLQASGYFSRGNQISSLTVDPGDTIFVPEEINKTTWIQNAKDWTQILYQMGIGIAGIKSAVK